MGKIGLEVLKHIANSSFGVFAFVVSFVSYASLFVFEKYLDVLFLNIELKYYIYFLLLLAGLGVFFSLVSAIRKELNEKASVEQNNSSLKLINTIGMHEQLLNIDGKLDNEELLRLALQGDRNYQQDIDMLTDVLHQFKKNNVSLLDIGCGNGYVTYSRMDYFNKITKVVGIDKNNEVINKANSINRNHEKYEFRTYDIESVDFAQIGELSGNKNSKFDIVFCSLVLSHMENPYQLIVNIKTILNKGGIVIFRSSDDGTKICYPNSEVLQSILDYTQKIAGISDRYNARKVLSYLKSADFGNITSSYDIIDTIGKSIDERKRLFEKSFSFRRKYLNKTILKGVKTDFSKDEFDKLLSKLERNFLDSSFYYMEISYLFVAKLK